MQKCHKTERKMSVHLARGPVRVPLVILWYRIYCAMVLTKLIESSHSIFCRISRYAAECVFDKTVCFVHLLIGSFKCLLVFLVFTSENLSRLLKFPWNLLWALPTVTGYYLLMLFLLQL